MKKHAIIFASLALSCLVLSAPLSAGTVTAVADGKAIVTVRTPEGRSAGCAVYVGQAAADYEKRDRQLTKAALGGMGILGALFLLLGIAL